MKKILVGLLAAATAQTTTTTTTSEAPALPASTPVSVDNVIVFATLDRA